LLLFNKKPATAGFLTSVQDLMLILSLSKLATIRI
jgi:hypothetical protein